MKTEISQTERLQLIGLLTLAKGYNSKLNDIHKAVRSITGEEDDIGHCCDAVFSDYEADELLENLGISVLNAAAHPTE